MGAVQFDRYRRDTQGVVSFSVRRAQSGRRGSSPLSQKRQTAVPALRQGHTAEFE